MCVSIVLKNRENQGGRQVLKKTQGWEATDRLQTGVCAGEENWPCFFLSLLLSSLWGCANNRRLGLELVSPPLKAAGHRQSLHTTFGL